MLHFAEEGERLRLSGLLKVILIEGGGVHLGFRMLNLVTTTALLF